MIHQDHVRCVICHFFHNTHGTKFFKLKNNNSLTNTCSLNAVAPIRLCQKAMLQLLKIFLFITKQPNANEILRKIGHKTIQNSSSSLNQQRLNFKTSLLTLYLILPHQEEQRPHSMSLYPIIQFHTLPNLTGIQSHSNFMPDLTASISTKQALQCQGWEQLHQEHCRQLCHSSLCKASKFIHF